MLTNDLKIHNEWSKGVFISTEHDEPNEELEVKNSTFYQQA